MANAASDTSGRAMAPAPSLKRTISEIVVVTIVAGALGAGFAWTQPSMPSSAPKSAADVGSDDKPAQASDRLAAVNIFELPPIITNLAAPADTWVRLEASIVFDAKETPHPETLGGEIAGDLLGYLRTMTVAQLEGPIGLQNLRQDLSERASVRSGGKVTELIIRTLVVQ